MSLRGYIKSIQDLAQRAQSDAGASNTGSFQTFEDRLLALLKSFTWIISHISFWSFVLAAALLAAIYFYVIADPIYVSQSVVSIRHKVQIPNNFGAILGNLTGGGTTSDEDAALSAYILSHEMLTQLDKEFSLRTAWSHDARNPFTWLSSSASDETFLNCYHSMVELDVRYDVGLVTIRVLDYNPERAQEINQAIIVNSEAFMNAQATSMMEASLKFARAELHAAAEEVGKAPSGEGDVANLRLQAAEQSLAAASSVAGQQQVFVVQISSPSRPTVATRPERLLDTLAVTLIAAILYAIALFALANIRDHQKV